MRLHKKITFIALLILCTLSVWILLYMHQHTWPHTFALLSAFCLLVLGLMLVQGINQGYSFLFHQGALAPHMMHYFGYQKNQSFTECWILKIILQSIIVVGDFYFIIQQFKITQPIVHTLYQPVLHGVPLANATIYPTRIVAGMIVFCVLYLMCRRLSTQLSRKEAFEKEEEAQVAILSLLTYMGFALALIAGLWTAGFDFTGLTVVAGALSVGIGLGLQGIVNNFVSGLILIIEKPMKPGDRITIDGIEGVVKKIHVRSTQLITAQREDVMIPNSHFMTHPITNSMYTDKHLLIRCELSVPYGTDPQKVRSLLLQIAKEHPDVLQGTQHQPFVLFRAFGEQALLFELCCVIKDGGKKSIVQSDLNFSIDRYFREHDLSLVVPRVYMVNPESY